MADALGPTACFQYLPFELAVTILQLSIDPTRPQRSRARISLVARSWYQLVQNTPSIWTDISGHDSLSHTKTALLKSQSFPIDIYYSQQEVENPKISIHVFFHFVAPHISRWCSLHMAFDTSQPSAMIPLPTDIHNRPAPLLESLTLRGKALQRNGIQSDRRASNLFGGILPCIQQIEVDGVLCRVPPEGFVWKNMRSINLVDVRGVTMECLLDVLRHSSGLKSLQLGRSPTDRPTELIHEPVHLPCLRKLHLIYMPIPVTNFLLSTIHAPNCSQLFINSSLSDQPAVDVLTSNLFTPATAHFSHVLQKLLACGTHKNIEISNSYSQTPVLRVQFHDENQEWRSLTDAILRLYFRLASMEQLRLAVRWLISQLGVKPSIRLFLREIQDTEILELLDDHARITHFGYQIPLTQQSHLHGQVFDYMTRLKGLARSLPNMEVFYYGSGSYIKHDVAMIKMLRTRYKCNSNGLSALENASPLREIRIGTIPSRRTFLMNGIPNALPEVKVYDIPKELAKSQIWG